LHHEWSESIIPEGIDVIVIDAEKDDNDNKLRLHIHSNCTSALT
jgi:hypothetical protein